MNALSRTIRGGTARAAFSLAELMIAITILGLGLLMVATMFPIAWGKARELSEHTTSITCADAANMVVKMTTQVAGPVEEPELAYSSFAGDYVNGSVHPESVDTWVHYLTLGNILTEAKSDGSPPLVAEDTWLLVDEKSGDSDRYNFGEIADGPVRWHGIDSSTDYPPPVMLHERVYPSLDPYPVDSDDAAIDEWYARMGTRRFAWGVFHRLNQKVTDPSETRTFTMYYVTLRRTPTQRFIRQDEEALPAGIVRAKKHNSPDDPTDLMFPVPWLVPIITPDPDIGGNDRELNYRQDQPSKDQGDVVPRGVPTEVMVEVSNSGDDYRDFFTQGAWMIDHETGETYRVAKIRYDDSGDKPTAHITLDRELFVEDIVKWDDEGFLVPRNSDDPDIELYERRVWVFPPAIERIASDEWAVAGPSPIVDLDVRIMTVRP